MALVGSVMEAGSLSLLTGESVSQTLVQSSMESLWSLINVNQMIAFMPLMNIHFPTNALLLFQKLAFLNGDVKVLQEAYDLTAGQVFSFP